MVAINDPHLWSALVFYPPHKHLLGGLFSHAHMGSDPRPRHLWSRPFSSSGSRIPLCGTPTLSPCRSTRLPHVHLLYQDEQDTQGGPIRPTVTGSAKGTALQSGQSESGLGPFTEKLERGLLKTVSRARPFTEHRLCARHWARGLPTVLAILVSPAPAGVSVLSLLQAREARHVEMVTVPRSSDSVGRARMQPGPLCLCGF